MCGCVPFLDKNGTIRFIFKNKFHGIFAIHQLGLRRGVEYIAVWHGNFRDGDIAARYVGECRAAGGIGNHLADERTVRSGYAEPHAGNALAGFGVQFKNVDRRFRLVLELNGCHLVGFQRNLLGRLVENVSGQRGDLFDGVIDTRLQAGDKNLAVLVCHIVANFSAVCDTHLKGHTLDGAFGHAVHLDDAQRRLDAVAQGDFSNLPGFQRDAVNGAIHNILRGSGDFLHVVGSGFQIRKEDDTGIICRVLTYHLTVRLADLNHHVGNGIAVRVNLADSQAGLGGILKGDVSALVRFELHGNRLVVGNVAGSRFNLLDDDGRHVQIVEENHAVVVRHTGVDSLCTGDGERKLRAHDALTGVRVHLGEHQTGLLVVADGNGGYVIHDFDSLRSAVEDITGRGFQLGDNPACAGFHRVKGNLSVLVRLIDALAAPAVAGAKQVAVRRFDFKNHTGDKRIGDGIALFDNELFFEHVGQFQFVGLSGFQLHGVGRGVDLHIVRCVRLSDDVPVGGQLDFCFAVLIRDNRPLLRTVAAFNLECDALERVAVVLRCLDNLDSSVDRLVLVDNHGNFYLILLNLNGLHGILCGQVACRRCFLCDPVAAGFQSSKDAQAVVITCHIRGKCAVNLLDGEHRSGQRFVRQRVKLLDFQADAFAVFDLNFNCVAGFGFHTVSRGVQCVAGGGFGFFDVIHADGRHIY